MSTRDLVRNWQLAVDEVVRSREAVANAEKALLLRVNNLGKVIDPGDLGPGEKVGIWVRVPGVHAPMERLVIVSVEYDGGPYRLCFRGTEREVSDE